MFKRFLSGVVFGAGFTVAALGLYTVWVLYFFAPLIDQRIDSEQTAYHSPEEPEVYPHTPNFRELSVDEKVQKSSAILILRFEEGQHGNYRSIVEEVLKQEQGIELYYEQGEVYEEDSHYSTSDKFVPRRAVVFMQGSPAKMSYSTTFSGERIRGLGGISLSLLREKSNNT
ncbi:hypothetical protein [Marinobacter sp. F3R08]|uniref:hypothetical protein n=1 Tax=Marinobacter sp. F3R08 TaxID=2841559 RepID=UPI001C0999FC|nr:hypothetical protein [Marinobacter sp. F3R08]MBU2952749.1 hypothetical protein [Marinobacter sp. F3R08]